jgi:hypothetical protein
VALIQLTRMWLTSVVTAESFGWYTAPDRGQSYTVRGEIRTYAGGRQRAVGSTGTAGHWSFTLVELTLDDIAQLREWLSSGVTVFARDHRGQSMYGTFFDVAVSEVIPAILYTDPNNRFRAGITINQVDVVEGV